MDRGEEIESAISSLRPEDYRRFVEWFRTREQTRWDEQMGQDSVAGKLDFLFREAEIEIRARADPGLAVVKVNSVGTRRIWALFRALPTDVQELAIRSYHLWRRNPHHPRSTSAGCRAERIVSPFALETTIALLAH
jgi:hypothetical protein